MRVTAGADGIRQQQAVEPALVDAGTVGRRNTVEAGKPKNARALRAGWGWLLASQLGLNPFSMHGPGLRCKTLNCA